ncbi:unnamed protein product [Arabidopsis lyrata]|uniref:Hydroxyproline-rich glycoprotein family protein n=1 Tax=Arabidopsis lyrata subsp. lyrata TaxID=81972 RepID=D7KR37_ARALL|nr:histone-lysine N-methyltransferase SETD1A [Arabidopsis lyrata subsp. lyrata]EFH63710.1 hypothetical protein ARALYDRAFT_476416 [Arabidopsis lyrata subsp. lyrata]CAH8257974.1 unnamed protein product [Arabidopsis lyrata]|eukprot:XP_020891519.1 histone-lysine N-methyltransferase SETD1A [Arabidopsis lyrata subsp. lyrata]
MEEEDGDASTPFWLQSRRNNTYFRRTASLGGRATTVATQIFFAGTAAILIVFFIIPPLFSSVSQVFRPHLVRKSWDYLNFVLVLFAVLCGFLSRNTNNDETNHNKEEDISNKFSNSPSIIDRGGRVSNSATPRYWIDDRGGGGGDQTVYKRFSRLRSVSSYPDLRLREYEADERWRFYDDTRVSQCRYEDVDPIYPNQSYRNWQEEVKPPPEDLDQTEDGGNEGGGKVHSGGSETEKVEVFETAEAEVVEELTVPSAPPYIPSPPPSPPRPPPPKQAKRKTKRVYQDVPPKEENNERSDFVAATPMTPIPPPATVYQKSNKQEKKKGGATKDFLIALRRKKKKQRQQSIDGLDLLFGSDPPLVYSPPPPPPPPPPFFQGLFSSKKGKGKKNNSNPPPPPPPPPPERRYESRASMTSIRKAPVESRTSKPNPPARVTQFVGTGSESPLMPIPPPPPPPPFKMPAWKFVKRGDYVRMASDISISSDEPDDPDVAQSAEGKVAAGSMFCPSPDVDTKADDFIARFRAGLKLEKMNSVKRGRSNLGPEPGLNESGS